MAEDWALDVRKYAPAADDAVIAGIVRHCGIALRTRDASLVSFTDPAETDRVRESFCRRKLGLTAPDAEIDAVIARVGDRMRGDHTKNRVTVYYLLAEAFGKLGLFGAADPAGAHETPWPAAAATVATAPVFAHSPVAAAAIPAGAAVLHHRRAEPGTVALAGCGLLAAIIVVTAAIGMLAGRHAERDPLAVAATTTVPTPPVAAPSPAIPTGAGVVAQTAAGKPMVSVYFATAKTDIAPGFATAAASLKTWLDGHPGARLAVSGFNDPRGNAAFNAELSKNRAKAVAAALATLGVPSGVIDLEKPPETTDTTTSLTQARRVDIVVKDAA